jgi:hypothetical protein
MSEGLNPHLKSSIEDVINYVETHSPEIVYKMQDGGVETYYTKFELNGEKIQIEVQHHLPLLPPIVKINNFQENNGKNRKLLNVIKNTLKKQNRVNEAWPQRELDRKATSYRRREFEPYKREKNIQKLFGKYAEDVPPQVIQYLRKIPGTIVKRLVDIYGYDRIEGYLQKAVANQVQENYNFDEIISQKNKSNQKF